MADKGLRLSESRGFARCPRCNQLIDSSVEVCRFCGATLNRDEIQKSAALQKRITEAKAKENNRKAMVAAIVSVFGTAILYLAWFGIRLLIRFRWGIRP